MNFILAPANAENLIADRTPASAVVVGPTTVIGGQPTAFYMDVTYADGSTSTVPGNNWQVSGHGDWDNNNIITAPASLDGAYIITITGSYTESNTTVQAFITVTVTDIIPYQTQVWEYEETIAMLQDTNQTTGLDKFGSIAISPNGNRLAVSHNYGSNVVSHDTIRVFNLVDGDWVFDVALNPLLGPNKQLGWDLEFSADGDTIVAGASAYNNFDGGVVTWDYNGTTWDITTITVPDQPFTEYAGRSIALTSDKLTMYYGSQGISGNVAGVYCVTRIAIGASWAADHRMESPDHYGTTANFGYGLSMSDDGTVMVSGTATMRVIDGVMQTPVPLPQQDLPAGVTLSASVSTTISGDGNTILVAGNSADKISGSGAAVYTRTGDVWSLAQYILVPYYAGDVDARVYAPFMAKNSSVLAIGSYFADSAVGINTGAIFMYVPGDTGYEYANTLTHDVAGSSFGRFNALTYDGNTLMALHNGSPTAYETRVHTYKGIAPDLISTAIIGATTINELGQVQYSLTGDYGKFGTGAVAVESWSSSNVNALTIDAAGLATTLDVEGDTAVTITAMADGVPHTLEVTVKNILPPGTPLVGYNALVIDGAYYNQTSYPNSTVIDLGSTYGVIYGASNNFIAVPSLGKSYNIYDSGSANLDSGILTDEYLVLFSSSPYTYNADKTAIKRGHITKIDLATDLATTHSLAHDGYDGFTAPFTGNVEGETPIVVGGRIIFTTKAFYGDTPSDPTRSGTYSLGIASYDPLDDSIYDLDFQTSGSTLRYTELHLMEFGGKIVVHAQNQAGIGEAWTTNRTTLQGHAYTHTMYLYDNTLTELNSHVFKGPSHGTYGDANFDNFGGFMVEPPALVDGKLLCRTYVARVNGAVTAADKSVGELEFDVNLNIVREEIYVCDELLAVSKYPSFITFSKRLGSIETYDVGRNVIERDTEYEGMFIISSSVVDHDNDPGTGLAMSIESQATPYRTFRDTTMPGSANEFAFTNWVTASWPNAAGGNDRRIAPFSRNMSLVPFTHNTFYGTPHNTFPKTCTLEY